MFRFIPLLYLFLIGCSDSDFMLAPVDEVENPQSEEIHQRFYFDSNPRLDVDQNGYYHLDIDMNNWQTLHRLSGFIIDSATTSPVQNCRVDGHLLCGLLEILWDIGLEKFDRWLRVGQLWYILWLMGNNTHY